MKRLALPSITGIILAMILIAGFAVFVPDVHAQALQGDELFGGGTGEEFAGQAGLGSASLTETIATIIRIFLGFLGVVLVVFILYGGFLWMTAGGNDDRVKKAKKTITNSVIGMVIVLSSFAITQFVINSIQGATTGGGIVTDDGGGYVDNGGGAAGTFYLQSFNEECAEFVRNVQLTWIFSQNVSASTVLTDGGISVAVSGGDAVEGTFAVNRNIVTFTPSATCAGGTEQCFDEGTTYVATAFPSILRSTSGKALQCTEAPCQSLFTVGSDIDTSPPSVVDIDAPDAGASIIQGGTPELLQAYTEDVAGISSVDFLVNSSEVYTAGFSDSTAGTLSETNTFFTDTNVEWDTAGYVTNRAYDIFARAVDCTGRTASSSAVRVVLRAENCGNGVLDADFGETDIDCGGSPSSQFYCGSCDGDACETNEDCASGTCENGQCVSIPKITAVSPGDGAVGNYVTIKGSGFESYGGPDSSSVVRFLGTEPGEAIDVAPLSCGGGEQWTASQIVIQVPEGAADGPIEVVTASGVSDRTDDVSGPTITNFDVNDVVRPGLCSVLPTEGLASSTIEITGNNLGGTPGTSTLYFDSYTAAGYTGWSEQSIGAVVPNVNGRMYDLQVFVGDNECQTGGEICATDDDCALEGDVCVLARHGSNEISYRVLSQAADTLPVIQSVDSGWKTCDSGLDAGQLCGSDLDCAGGASCVESASTGPSGQYVTIYGNHFGTSEGSVWFVDASGGAHTGVATLADVQFPAVCSEDFWHYTDITVKVPEFYPATEEGEEYGDPVDTGMYNLYVQRADGQSSETVPFEIVDADPGPAICSIVPGAGPANTLVTIYGENFGSTPNAVNFYDAETGQVDAGADILGSTWENQSIALVPVTPGAETGPVIVTIPSGYTSNSYNFTVGDCRNDASICGEGTQCCANGSCAISCDEGPVDSYYAWKFSTGPLDVRPQVLVQCNAAAISPSPWEGWSDPADVCLNAAVTASFTVPMDGATFADNVRVDKCLGSGADPCEDPDTDREEVMRGGGSVSAIGFSWTPVGGLFEPSTTYQVTLNAAGIQSEDAQYMASDFSWQFTTSSSSDPCVIGDVSMSPDAFLADEAGQIVDYLAQPIAANDQCVVLACTDVTEAGAGGTATSYEVSWESNDAGAALIGSFGGAYDTCEMRVRAEQETPAGNPADITAVFSAPNDPSDTGELTINFTDPRVSDYFPSCETACVNAAIEVAFNTEMRASTLIAGNMRLRKCLNALCLEYVGSPISIQDDDIDCIDPDGTCSTTDPLTWNRIRINLDENLEPNTYYRMSLDGETIRSASGVPLSEAGANDGNDFSWIFRTKNDDTECTVDRITVSPKTARLKVIGARQEFHATAWGAPDECSVNGQILNTEDFAWNPWEATDSPNVFPDADVAFMLGTGATPGEIRLASELPGFCTDSCLRTGTSVQYGDPICGNGIREAGEDCDDGNVSDNDDCSSSCLTRGSSACESTCLLSSVACTVDSTCAETCAGAVCEDFEDAGETCAVNGDCLSNSCDPITLTCDSAGDAGTRCAGPSACDSGACSGSCSISDAACDGTSTACPFAADTCSVGGGSCCGNGVREGREECDDGDLLSGDGCSSQCLNEGSVLVGATCGNGFVDFFATLGGEECDDGNRRSGDGCSSVCLNEGSVPQTGVFAVCGNGGAPEDGEDCDNGSQCEDGTSCSVNADCAGIGDQVCRPRSGDGCSDTCLNEGTLVCASECSVSRKSCNNDIECGGGQTCDPVNPSCCGNSVVDFGEDCDGGEGCSASCLNLGSSVDYSTASYCGDALPGIGEECEAESAAGAVTGAYGVAESDPGAAQEIDEETRLATSVISVESTNVTGEAVLEVQCACQTDLACGEPSTLGCGESGCCYERPLAPIAAYPASDDVCLNTAVWVEFDRRMDPDSFDQTVDTDDDGVISPTEYEPNIYLALDVPPAGCLGDEYLYVTYNDLPRPNVFVRAWRWVKTQVRGLFGLETQASVANRCLLPVDYSVENTEANGQRVRLLLPALLESNQRYEIFVQTDPNNEDGIREGVLSADGVSISGNPLGEYIVASFETGSEICELEAVQGQDLGVVESLTDELVEASPRVFTQTTEEHAVDAQTYTIRASGAVEEIAAVPGQYEWEWTYGSSDNDVVSLQTSGLPEYKGLATAEGTDGRATLLATATITTDTLNEESTVGKQVTGSLDVTALLCENPWPAIGEWPYIDEDMSFSFHYCRDRGAAGTEDDLPELRVVDVPTPLSGILKEFLYIVDGTGDALGVRVVGNGGYLSPSAWYVSQGFGASATPAQVDGYEAVRDRNTMYVAAANQTGDIYSNIYAISSNDGAGTEASDIFEQILNNFQFNATEGIVTDYNICRNGAGDYVTNASGEFVSCEWDGECVERCLDAGGVEVSAGIGTCSVTGAACTSSSDCALGLAAAGMCDAEKTKLTRDLKRLQDLVEIQDRIGAWGAVNGHCSVTQEQACVSDTQCPGLEVCVEGVPEIPSGSFIRNTSVSAWPSWNSELGNTLGTALPLDPLNQFMSGGFPGCTNPYDPSTCYNGTDGTFACGIGSHVYVYQGLGGENYRLYAQLEYDAAPWVTDIDADSSDNAEIHADYEAFSGAGPLPDGFSAAPTYCADSVYGSSSACGDGVIGPGEVCEIGNTSVAACRVCMAEDGTLGDRCDVGVCGAGEVCTDGTIRIACYEDAGNACVWQTALESVSQCVPYVCGNGVIDPTEECDDGAANGTYGHCSLDCQLAGRIFCGDGYLAGGEQCDCGSPLVTTPGSWAALNGCTAGNGQYSYTGTSCDFDCTTPGPTCGDGEVNGAEECDSELEEWAGALCNGGTNDREPCVNNNDCDSGQCGGTNPTNACGSSIICVGGTRNGRACTGGGGACESGGGTCSTQIYDLSRTRTCGSGVACEWGDWSFCSAGDQFCGNGVVEGDEACDDGNADNTDSCNTSCELNVCGDDNVYVGVESCDDGDENGELCTAGYGGTCQYCSESCQLKTSSGSFCGDGVINGTEFCDGDQVPPYCFNDSTGVGERGSMCSPSEVNTQGSCAAGFTCRNVGICNGGTANGDTCTLDSTAGTDYLGCAGGGECVAPVCADDCGSSCPVNLHTTSILAQVEGAGATQEEEIELYSYLNDEGNNPDNAVLFIPACTVGTTLTASIDKSDIVPPSIDLVFVTDRSGSMTWYTESDTGAPVGQRRIDYVVDATNDAIADLLETYDVIGGEMRIGLVSFQGSSANIDVGFTSSESTLTSAVSSYLSPAPVGGTPMSLGLDTAVGMFSGSTADVQVVVLLADGDPNNGCPASHAHSNGVTYTTSQARVCTTYMNDVVWDNEDIQFYSAVINSDPALQGYMAHISNDACTCTTTSIGCNWSDLNDCSVGENGIEYAYQATDSEEISAMYEAIIDGVLGAVVSFTSDVDGVATVTSGSVRDGNSVILPFPDGFECDGTTFTIPFNITYNYSSEEADASVIRINDFEFSYCPTQ